MKIIGLHILIFILKMIRLPVIPWRRYKRKRFIGQLHGVRAAYYYAKWVDDRATVGNTRVNLVTDAGTLSYERPLTIRKLVRAYRDR